uniref:Uncharacterized protein n=1 Tax=viral metagenome TaxID=1070528 RepID=A0A6M3L8F1_9ZZZZ
MRINKPIQRWFSAPDDPDKSEHLIRHLLPGEILDTINEATKQETKYIVGKDGNDLVPEMTSETKTGEVQKRQFLLALVGWKNMFDENGKPMEFNESNKIRALREIEGYMAFVTDCRNRLAEDVEKEKEARVKN